MGIGPRLTAALAVVAALAAACESTAPRESPPEAKAQPPAQVSQPSAAEPTATPAAEPAKASAPAAPEPVVVTMSVADMQKRLTALGYRPGPADGVIGPRTINALKRFQRDRKLPPTGMLDPETIAQLHKPAP